MKILVIGGGFIAVSIVQRLESEGHEIRVYSRSENPEIKCRQILGDIFNFEEFLKALTWKPTVIIHSAWITSPGVYRNDLSNIKYAKFTSELAHFIQDTDVEHLVVLGTCAEYGFQSSPSTAGITSLTPNTLYAEQKVAALTAVREILQESAVRLTWARVFYPYGPNQNQKRLIPHLIHSLKNGVPVKLADTSSIHDWITTRDISSAISWVIDNKVPLEIDIATSVGFTNLALLNCLEDILQIRNQSPGREGHDVGLNEVFLAGKESPLFVSGWLPQDTLTSGLEWVLSSCRN
jgi:nucleoside-diphosphate-sugar epimerase